MDQIARSVRKLLNPYSTAFSAWWCHFSRQLRLPSTLADGRAAARPVSITLESAHVTGSAYDTAGLTLVHEGTSPQGLRDYSEYTATV